MAYAATNGKVHGHRGCRGLRPENTLPAFLHAVALGVEVLELDVVLSADQQVVVSHEPWMSAAICLDPAGRRIPAAQQLAHNLYRMPYATIRQYDCGRLRHPSFHAQQPQPAHKPLLQEVVAQVDSLTQKLGRPPVRFSLEVKSSPAGDHQFHPSPALYAARVLAEIEVLDLAARTTVLCFDYRILQEVRRHSPSLPLCLLVEDTLPFEHHLTKLGFTPAIYGPHHSLVSPALVAPIQAANMQLVPWTVNETADMIRLLDLGADALTTDYPDRLLAVLTARRTASV